MIFLMLILCIVSISAVAVAYVVSLKNKEIREKLKTIVSAVDSTDTETELKSVDDIIGEIDSIRMQKMKLEAVVAATPYPMLIAGADGLITSANQAGIDLLEIENKKTTDFIGQTVSAFFYNEPSRPAVTDKVIQTRKAITGIEATLKTRKNREIHVIVDSGPIISSTGDLVGAFSIAMDVTPLKNAELEVKKKNEALAQMRNDAEIMSAQLAASIEEFQNTVKEIQNNVIGNENVAKEINEFIGQLTRSFSDFNATLVPVIDGVKTLGQDLKEIEDATSAIKSISEQTDILALNARIEAERSSTTSGNSNEGFKIVAREVKDLATKSKEITGEIMKVNGHISGVLTSSSSSLDVMKEKFDQIVRDLENNSTSGELMAISSGIRDMLFQVDEAILEMGRSAASLNSLIRDT